MNLEWVVLYDSEFGKELRKFDNFADAQRFYWKMADLYRDPVFVERERDEP